MTDTSAPQTETKTIIKQNGIKRPDAGSVTGKLWDIADEISNSKGAPATRKEVVDRYMAEVSGANQATANTQYARWTTFHGVGSILAQQRKAEAEQRKAAKAAEGEAAKKAKEEAKAAKAAEAQAKKEAREKAKADKEAEKARKAEERAAVKREKEEAAARAKAEKEAAKQAAANTENTAA